MWGDAVRGGADSEGVLEGQALGNAEEEDGDVVVAAMGVGGVDEGVAGRFEPGFVVEDGGDLQVGDVAGEAVGGEQVEVAGSHGMPGDVGLDRGLRAEGAGDDVADGRGGSLGAAECAGTNLFFDQRMVLGEEVQRTFAQEVAAAVAHMGQPEDGILRGLQPRLDGFARNRGIVAFEVEQGSDQGCAHAVEAWRFAGVAEDGVVGGADGLAEPGVGMAGTSGEVG